MINVQVFKIEHLKNFESKNEFEDLERDMKRNITDITKTIFSLIWKEKTLAIVGLSEFRKGVGEVWILPSIYVDKCKFAFYKMIRSLIYNLIFPEMKFHRLEIAILKGWDQGIKWAKSLGFKESHICEAYDSLYRDHIIFVRINKWQLAQP